MEILKGEIKMNERNILLGDYLGKFGFDYYIEDDSWNGEFKRAIVLVEMEDCEMPQAEDIKRILNKKYECNQRGMGEIYDDVTKSKSCKERWKICCFQILKQRYPKLTREMSDQILQSREFVEKYIETLPIRVAMLSNPEYIYMDEEEIQRHLKVEEPKLKTMQEIHTRRSLFDNLKSNLKLNKNKEKVNTSEKQNNGFVHKEDDFDLEM